MQTAAPESVLIFWKDSDAIFSHHLPHPVCMMRLSFLVHEARTKWGNRLFHFRLTDTILYGGNSWSKLQSFIFGCLLKLWSLIRMGHCSPNVFVTHLEICEFVHSVIDNKCLCITDSFVYRDYFLRVLLDVGCLQEFVFRSFTGRAR